jgi:hypothetical protein
MKTQTKPFRFTSQPKKQFIDSANYSSFGKMILSEKVTEPRYIIGRAHRDKQNTGLSKKLLQTQLLGKTSPGCVYNVKDDFTVPKSPEWSIGNAERAPLDNKEKYEHYFIQDKFSDIGKAYDSTQPNNKEIRFGSTRRVVALINSSSMMALPNTSLQVPNTILR